MPTRRVSRATGGDPAREAVDPRWVGKLTGASRGSVANALEEGREESALVHHIDAAHRSAGRPSYAQIRAPYEFFALVRLLRPAHVVEVGVSSGVSSSFFLQALRKNGSGVLHSIDLPTPQKGAVFDPKTDSPVALPPGKTTGWAVPAALRQGWDLRIGPSSERLPPLIDELPSVGIFLHDSLHTYENATFELTTADRKVPSGGVFLCDNTEWLGGALVDFARSKGTRACYRSGSDLGGFRKP